MGSVLDGIPVENKAFPLTKARTVANAPALDGWLEIVGHCPKCGSPIYGKARCTTESPLVTRHSCGCQHNPKAFTDTMLTK